MQNNLIEKEPRTLSQSARAMIADLQKRARAILESDARREPKLSGEESAEVAELSARLEVLRPVCQRLVEQLESSEARAKHLASNMTDLIIAGENAEKLVSEAALLKPLIVALADATNAALLEASTAEARVQTVKENARIREARNER